MKKAIISRLLNSQSPPFLKPHYYRDRSLFAARNGRFLSTGSEKVDGSSTLEEAERVEFTPPKEKLLVLGGNGFVGSHICIEALAHGLDVSSLSRDLLSPDSLGNAMNGVTSVISCVGGFGSNSYMYDINGTANINAIRAASEQGVKRFVYISAADFGLVNYLLKGYYAGKVNFISPKTIRETPATFNY
uniref:NAD-dependent epimerase/dehydratase domain-containing protein n=1 Tax=Salix viminalis TaxID=40686 RepID=A0A6N2LFI8_SALVM